MVDNLATLSMPGLSAVCRRIDKLGYTLAYEPILDTKRDSVEVDILIGMDLVNMFVDWSQKPQKIINQFCLPTIYGITPSGPIPQSERIKAQQTINLVVANVAILEPDEEIDEDEGVNSRGIIDALSNMENIGINVSDRQMEDVLAYQQFKSTIKYDERNHQFSVGFPWRFGEPPKISLTIGMLFHQPSNP